MKKPAFFAGCMALQGRVALRRLPALLAMALAGLLLSGLVALAGRSALAGQGFAGLTLVVAAEEEDPQLETLLDMLAGMEELRQVAAIRRAAPDEAEALVQSGAAAAAVVLPAGFLPSVMQGENLAPRLLVDSSRPVEMALVSQVAQSAVAMLTRAQQGIAFTLEYYDTTTSGAPKRATVVQGINLAYASWVLGREGMFRPEIHQAGGAMGLVPHYLLGAALFFVLLCLPVLHRLYALPAQGGWLGRPWST